MNGVFVTLLLDRFAADQMLRELAQEWPAPDADGQQGREDHDGVDAHSARPCPVDILEVEPQRELVERQRRGDSVGKRGRAGEPPRSGALFDEPDVSDSEEQEDAPHQVMDVKPTAADVVDGPYPGADEVRDAAHDGERDEETERGEKEALPALVLKMKLVDPLEGAQCLGAEGSPAPGAARKLIFEDREIVARERVDMALERKRPVFGWPLTDVIQPVRELLGRYPVSVFEDHALADVNAPRIVLISPRRAPDRRVVFVHRRGHRHACGKGHAAGHVVEHPIADAHRLDTPQVAALQTLDGEAVLARLAEVFGRADDHPELRGTALRASCLPLAPGPTRLGGTFGRRRAVLDFLRHG